MARLYGYRVVGWSAAVEDWSATDAGDLAERLRTRVRRGDIVLLHDGSIRWPHSGHAEIRSCTVCNAGGIPRIWRTQAAAVSGCGGWRTRHSGVSTRRSSACTGGWSLGFVPEAVVHIRYRSGGAAVFHQARAYGRGAVALYVRHRPVGMPRLPLRDGLRGWGKIVLRVPRLARAGARERWLWKLGVRVGRLEGCLAYRCLAL